MDNDTLNMELRKFLKKVGITSQREIENAIRKNLELKKLSGNECLDVSVKLELPKLDLKHKIEGQIKLDKTS